MKSLRSSIEVSPALHPDLFVALAGIDKPRARAEKLRFLACLGLVIEQQGADLKLISPAVRQVDSHALVIRLTVSGAYHHLLNNLSSLSPSSRAERLRTLARLGCALASEPQNGQANPMRDDRFLHSSSAGDDLMIESKSEPDTRIEGVTQTARAEWAVDSVAETTPPHNPGTLEPSTGLDDIEDGEGQVTSGIVNGETAKRSRKQSSNKINRFG